MVLPIAVHRFEYWKRKTDPQFDAKMRPIVDLYLNPPDDGPVWCFDEMTCIQALERSFSELSLRCPGELAKRSFEYVRHGTRCLLAALEVHAGRVLGTGLSPSSPGGVHRLPRPARRRGARRAGGPPRPRQPQHPPAALTSRSGSPSIPAASEAVIVAFIATYNRLHAHPYRWTYYGDPLVA